MIQKLLFWLILLLSLGAQGATTLPFITPTTAITLTDVASGRVFQRSTNTTDGPITLSGTYAGGQPTGIQAQVLNLANGTVLDWTSGTCSVLSGANWTCSFAGVPIGPVGTGSAGSKVISDSYHVKVRPSNATAVTATGSNQFYMGGILALYGQSNMVRCTGTTASSPPAAAAGTSFFNGSAWVAVPAFNCVRQILNSLVAQDGLPRAALNGSIDSQPIATLLKGNGSGYYEAFLAQIVAAGGDAEFILWDQGQGDAIELTLEATYRIKQSQLHADIVADIGRTKAQAPFLISNIATYGAGAPATDTSWNKIQAALGNSAALNASTYVSHWPMDAVYTDTVHYDAASQTKEGTRFARSITTLLGSTTGMPHWEVASAASTSTTTTTVTVAFATGIGATDFTPSGGTNITGFEVSGDNGFTWVTATALRATSTTIALTHSAVTTGSPRLVRYLYGLQPVVTGLVLDNSTLTLPLSPTAYPVRPTPAVAVTPVPSYWDGAFGGTAITGSLPSRYIGPATASNKILLIGFNVNSSDRLTSMTITPNSGSAGTATRLTQGASDILTAWYQYEVSGAATTVDISYIFSSTPFGNPFIALWSVPKNDLSSTTPVGFASNNSASAPTLSVSVPTSSGGFILAIGQSFAGGASSFAGSTETIGARYEFFAGARYLGGDTSGTASSGGSTVQMTGSGANIMGISAVSFR